MPHHMAALIHCNGISGGDGSGRGGLSSIQTRKWAEIGIAADRGPIVAPSRARGQFNGRVWPLIPKRRDVAGNWVSTMRDPLYRLGIFCEVAIPFSQGQIDFPNVRCRCTIGQFALLRFAPAKIS